MEENIKQINLFAFTQELIFFGLVGFGGIFIADFLRRSEVFIKAPQAQVEWWQFLIAFGIGTALILGLIRFWRKTGILRVFFLFAIFSGLILTLQVFFSDWVSLALGVLFLAIYFLWPKVWLHNVILAVSLAGIGALIGASLNPQTAVILLIIMSIYDYIAVYKTKHMVKMAQAMIEDHAIFALIFPEKPSALNANLAEARPSLGFMLLGTGDFVFPLIMAASSLYVSLNAALLVSGFALLGLLAMHLIFVLQKVRRPMPALPPLAAFSILGFLIAILLKI